MSNNAADLAVEMLESYKQLRKMRSDFLSRKFRQLPKTHQKYKLFDFEHPYYDMDPQSKNAVKSFEKMMKLMLDVDIEGSSVRNELSKMSLVLLLADKRDETIEKILKM